MHSTNIRKQCLIVGEKNLKRDRRIKFSISSSSTTCKSSMIKIWVLLNLFFLKNRQPDLYNFVNPEKSHAATKFVGDFSVVVLFYFFNVLIRYFNRFGWKRNSSSEQIQGHTYPRWWSRFYLESCWNRMVGRMNRFSLTGHYSATTDVKKMWDK